MTFGRSCRAGQNIVYSKPAVPHTKNSSLTYLQPVRSRRFRAIGYDWKSKSLEVEMHGGGVYRYNDVPDSIYYALMATLSKETYFSHVIERKYAFRRLR